MRNTLTSRLSLLILSFAIAMVVFPAMAMAATVDASGTTSASPTITSDKADYAPGETVTLTGSGWQPGTPGESVHIVVNDTYGATWQHTADVTADQNGDINDSFSLPSTFVSDYDVTATGSSGSVATTTFTDSNINIEANLGTNESTTVQWQRYSSTDCTGTALSGANNTGALTLSGTASGTATASIASGASSGSIKLTGDLQSSVVTGSGLQKKKFNNWVVTSTSGSVSDVPGSGENVTCTSGFNGGNNTHTYKAYYGNTAPSTPGTPSASPNPNNGQFTLSWTASTDTENNPVTYRLERKLSSDPNTSYSLVTGAGSLNTNSFSFTNGAEENAGTWTYRVQATDSSPAGNLSSAFSASSTAVTVDKTAPNVTLDKVNTQTVTFPYSTNQNVTSVGGSCTPGDGQVSVKRDTQNAVNVNCTGTGTTGSWSYSFTSLTSSGTYTFTATQTDAVGNTGSSGPQTVTIDKTAPATPTITDPADNSYNKTGTVTVSGTAEAGSTVKLFDGATLKDSTQAANNGANSAWTITLSNVADGLHTYTATATDAAGNPSVASGARRVTVDTQAPAAPVITAPANGQSYTQGTTVNAAYSCLDNTNGSGIASCQGTQNNQNVNSGSPFDTSTVGTGKTFTVTATDKAGNTQNATSTYNVVAANNAPSKPGTPSTSSNPNNGEFTLNWAASTDDGKPAGSSLTYTLQHKSSANGATFNDVATGLNTNSYTFGPNSKETEGTWTYQVIATDSALSTTSDASSAIKVDRTGPNAPTLSFNASASQSPKVTVGSVDWYKDSALINVADNGDKTLADGSAGSGVKAASLLPNPFGVSTNGTSTVTRTVEDNAGNPSSPSAALSVHVDAQAPTSSFGSASTADGPYGAGTYATKDVTVTLNATDAESGVEKIVYRTSSSGAYQDYPAGGIVVSQEGTTTIDFHAVDKVGHAESSDNHYTVKIDRTPIASKAIANTYSTSSPITVSYDVTTAAANDASGLKKVELWVKGPGQTGYSHSATYEKTTAQGSFSYPVSQDGDYSFYTITEDNAGNREATPATGADVVVTVTHDTNPPSLTVGHTPGANADGWNNSAVTLNVSASDSGSGLAGAPSCTDATTALTLTAGSTAGTWTANVSGEGTHTVKCSVSDKAGNPSGEKQDTVKIDTTKPVISGDGMKSGTIGDNGWYTSDVEYGFTATDPNGANGASGSGLAAADQVFTRTTTGEGSAIHVSSGTVTDLAGNVSDPINSPDFKVDKKDYITSQALANSYSNSTVTVNYTTTLNGDVSGLQRVELYVSGPTDNGAYNKVSGDKTAASGSSSYTPFSYTPNQGDGTYRFYTRAVDNAGNGESAPATADAVVTVTHDTAPPTSSVTSAKKADNTTYTGGEWTKQNVTVNIDANDSGSGVKQIVYSVDGGTPATVLGASASIPFGTEGAHTLSYHAVDNAGNAEADNTFAVNIDKTAPSVGTATAVKGTAPNFTDAAPYTANTWTNKDVKVSWTCTDAGSGPVNASDSQTVSTEGASGSVTPSCADNAGNTNTGPAFSPIKIDKTAQITSKATSPNAYSNGTSPITINYTMNLNGDLSGLGTVELWVSGPNDGTTYTKVDQTTSGSFNYTPNKGDGDYRFYTLAVDNAGNSESAPTTGADTIVTVRHDTVTPTTTASANNADNSTYAFGTWTNQSVNVTLSADDGAGSGVNVTKYTTDGSTPSATNGTTYSGPFTVSSEGTTTVKFLSVDKAGNPEAVQSKDVKIDKTAPAITDLGPTTNATNGWYNTDVTNRFKASDAGSGLSTTCVTNFPANTAGDNVQSKTTSGEGTALSVTSEGCTDVAGNPAQGKASADFKVDKTKPVISRDGIKSGTLGTNGWYTTDVGFGFTATDPNGANGANGSGLAVADQAFTKNITTEGLNQNVSSGTVSDLAGNVATAVTSPDFNIDKTDPTTPTFSGIQEQSYPVANLPAQSAISCSATDAISPPAPCAFIGYSSDYGSHTLIATATDQAGRTSTSKLIYTVGLQTSEVLSPFNSTGKANIAATNLDVFKIKSTIPVKFQLYKDAAKTQLMTSPPAGSVAKITFLKQDNTTDSNDAVDALPSSTPNTDNIYRWDGTNFLYIYNLGTTGKAAGTYSVQLTLYDSSASNATVLAQSAKYYFVLRT